MSFASTVPAPVCSNFILLQLCTSRIPPLATTHKRRFTFNNLLSFHFDARISFWSCPTPFRCSTHSGHVLLFNLSLVFNFSIEHLRLINPNSLYTFLVLLTCPLVHWTTVVAWFRLSFTERRQSSSSSFSSRLKFSRSNLVSIVKCFIVSSRLVKLACNRFSGQI